MSQSSTKSGINVGFFSLLAILFIGLKLAGCIAWSWWWVLSPLWIPPLVLLACVAFMAVVCLIALWVFGD